MRPPRTFGVGLVAGVASPAIGLSLAYVAIVVDARGKSRFDAVFDAFGLQMWQFPAAGCAALLLTGVLTFRRSASQWARPFAVGAVAGGLAVGTWYGWNETVVNHDGSYMTFFAMLGIWTSGHVIMCTAGCAMGLVVRFLGHRVAAVPAQHRAT